MATTRPRARKTTKKSPVEYVESAEDPLAPETTGDGASVATEAAEAAELAEVEGFGLPIRFPIFLLASGRYEWRRTLTLHPAEPGPIPVIPGIPRTDIDDVEVDEEVEGLDQAGLIPFFWGKEELRLDVDGAYPQMVVSGTIYSGPAYRVHWIANLRRTSTANVYVGYIWYKDGNVSWLPHTKVRVQVVTSIYSAHRKVQVWFTGGGAPSRVRTYRWKSRYYHPVEFEFDRASNAGPAVTTYNLWDHPNRPASLPNQTLSLATVYRRAGFEVKLPSNPNPTVPLSEAGADLRWSDMEMHDAMQIYWTRFANKPQWSMWVFFAWLHRRGSSLGGIMFDDIGPNHRQGTSIFNGSFIKNAPPGDPDPAAWVRRMKFWTAAHEMGHAFNLAHSWQKALVIGGKGPWIPLANEPLARSFMNYPFRVPGNHTSFFSDFEFRFTDGELLFMRHAPERFVHMGDALWFDDHGFEHADVRAGSTYKLELRMQRPTNECEFMEIPPLELKLSNVSGDPVVVDKTVLDQTENLTVIVKRQGATAVQWQPFAQYCFNGGRTALTPGHAIYRQLLLAGGIGGWPISQPGRYTVQVAVRIGDEDVVSNPLEIRVAPPRSYEEAYVAQDYFTEDVGRVLTFNGTKFLDGAVETLEHLRDVSKGRAARRASLALATPLTVEYKSLEFGTEAEPSARAVRKSDPDPDAAAAMLGDALFDRADEAAETLGHIDYRMAAERYSDFLAEQGDPAEAVKAVDKAMKTLKARNVLKSVLDDMTHRKKTYAKS